jgi:hypothetical protein
MAKADTAIYGSYLSDRRSGPLYDKRKKWDVAVWPFE